MLIPEWIKNNRKFRRDVIRSDSGISSKSYVMVEGMQLYKLIVYWHVGVLTVDIFTPYNVEINWLDFVAVIVSLSTFVLASAWGKIKGEQSYWSSRFDDAPNINKDDNL